MTDEQYHQHLQQARQALREALTAEGLTSAVIALITMRHSQIHAALSVYQCALIHGYETHMETLMRQELSCLHTDKNPFFSL